METFMKILTITLFTLGTLGTVFAYAHGGRHPEVRRFRLRLAVSVFVAAMIVATGSSWLLNTVDDAVIATVGCTALAFALVLTLRRDLFDAATSAADVSTK